MMVCTWIDLCDWLLLPLITQRPSCGSKAKFTLLAVNILVVALLSSHTTSTVLNLDTKLKSRTTSSCLCLWFSTGKLLLSLGPVEVNDCYLLLT